MGLNRIFLSLALEQTREAQSTQESYILALVLYTNDTWKLLGFIFGWILASFFMESSQNVLIIISFLFIKIPF